MLTRSHREGKAFDYFTHARTDVLDLLPQQFSSVVDVGGSSGGTLSAIKDKWPVARTICIDIHAASIAAARENGHEGFLCNIEKSMPDVFGTSQVVLLLDVLEHLTDPWRQLAMIASQLPVGATVIVSLPNVRYWDVSWRLFFLGTWTLKDAGVLDRTHLRFFTRQSGAEMLRGAGLHIRHVRSRLPGGRKYKLINLLSFGILEDFLTEQYIYASEK